MGCPDTCILGENITFTVQCRDGSGAPVDATGNVTYSIYEDETTTAIVSAQTMAKLDDANTTGLYSEQIATTTAIGYERYKTYTVHITATVDSVSVAKTYSFICMGADETISATSGSLTSTANFKTYAGISGSDDDSLIGALINRATNEIELYCGRTFASTSYTERYNGKGDKELLLNEYPVTAVSLFSTRVEDAFGAKNTSSDAYRASILVDSTNVTCTIYGGTNDGSDDLTIASYSTLTLLTAAITALGKGWEITLPETYASWNATDLLPQVEEECLDGFAYVQIPSENENNYEVDLAAGIVIANSKL